MKPSWPKHRFTVCVRCRLREAALVAAQAETAAAIAKIFEAKMALVARHARALAAR